MSQAATANTRMYPGPLTRAARSDRRTELDAFRFTLLTFGPPASCFKGVTFKSTFWTNSVPRTGIFVRSASERRGREAVRGSSLSMA
jgi:hypothetical protein